MARNACFQDWTSFSSLAGIYTFTAARSGASPVVILKLASCLVGIKLDCRGVQPWLVTTSQLLELRSSGDRKGRLARLDSLATLIGTIPGCQSGIKMRRYRKYYLTRFLQSDYHGTVV
jgi:hypothetical protein